MTGVLASRWEIISALSSAGFGVRNLGVKAVHGQVPIRTACVDVDQTGRPVAAHADLDLAGVETGNRRRDNDLRKPRLLDTERFPTLTFDLVTAEPDGDGWRLNGILTAHGQSIDVALAARLDAVDDQVGVRASTSFDRRDLGIRAPRLMIGHRIDVVVDVVLRPAVQS